MSDFERSQIQPSYNPLGLIRIAAVLYFAFFSLGDSISFLFFASEIDAKLMTNNLVLRALSAPFPFDISQEVLFGKTWLGLYKLIFYGSAFCALFGIFTRFSLFLFATSALYLCSILSANLLFNHEYVLTIYILYALAIVPGSKSISIDAFVRVMCKRSQQAKKVTPRIKRISKSVTKSLTDSRFLQLKTHESWGTKLILSLFFIIYLSSGLSKVILSEGRWWDGETLGFYLGRDDTQNLWIALDGEHPPYEDGKPATRIVDHTYGFETTGVSRTLARSRLLLILLSLSTLAWEFSSFLVFMRPCLRNAYLFVSILMHVSIGLTLHLGFPSFQIYLLLLIDWLSILNWAKKRFPSMSRLNTDNRTDQWVPNGKY